MFKPPRSLAERFWAKVAIAEPNDCWLWTASRFTNGYGQCWAMPERKANLNAHIVSWFFAHGTWPPPGMNVCHTCDNPPCVNPAHLWLGTQLDNMQDCAKKGRNGPHAHPDRMARGDSNGSRKHPERLARGHRNGAYTHPEKVRRGQANNRTKLTDSQREEIISLYNTGQWTLKQLGNHFGVSAPGVHHWVRHNKKLLTR